MLGARLCRFREVLYEYDDGTTLPPGTPYKYDDAALHRMLQDGDFWPRDDEVAAPQRGGEKPGAG